MGAGSSWVAWSGGVPLFGLVAAKFQIGGVKGGAVGHSAAASF
jgi:hypothetical protein